MSQSTRPVESRPSVEDERSVLEIQVHSRHFVRWKSVLVAAAIVAISFIGARSLLDSNAREAFAIVGTLSLCLVIVLKPQVGFWAYYLLGFARPHNVFWGFADLRISLGLAAVTLLSYLLHTGVDKRPFIRRDPILFCMLALTALVVFSSIANGVGQQRMIDLTKIFLFGVAFATWVDRKDWLRVSIRIVTVSLLFLTLWAANQKFNLGVYKLVGPGGASSTFKDRNYFAMVLVLGIPFYYYAAMRARMLVVKLSWLAMVPLTVMLVFATASRGGLLGIAGAGGMIAWQTRYRLPALVAGAVMLTGFYFATAPSSLKDRTGTIVNYQGEGSAEGRIDSWKAGLTMMAANPIVGVGPSNYVNSYRRYSSTRPRQAHNSLVQAAGEYGVAAPFLIILFHFYVYRRLVRLRDDEDADPEFVSWARCLLSALVGYWVCGFFLSAEGLELAYHFGALAVIMTTVLAREKAMATASANATGRATAVPRPASAIRESGGESE